MKDEELLEFIAENTYKYYLEQNTETSYTKSLQRALENIEKSIANLVRAIEQGIFNEATKNRMDELDEQKAEIKAALSVAKLRQDLGLKKEHVVYFLHQFANMDYTDLECQKRLIKIFVNSVFVYEDKVVLTFNYSGDNRTITLKEIDAGLQQGVRLPRALSHQKKASTLSVLFSMKFVSHKTSEICIRHIKERILFYIEQSEIFHFKYVCVWNYLPI